MFSVPYKELYYTIEHSGIDYCARDLGILTFAFDPLPDEPYSIEWNTGETTEVIGNLQEGLEYRATISMGSNACPLTTERMTVEAEWPCENPESYNIQSTITGTACLKSSGSINIGTITVECPNRNFTLESSIEATAIWSDGFQYTGPLSGIDRDNLPEGIYCLDLAVCGFELHKCFNIHEIGKPIIILDDIVAMECSLENPVPSSPGSILIAINSETDYDLLWTMPNGTTSSNEDLTDLFMFGIYTVTVTTASGCSVSRTFDMCCCFPASRPWHPAYLGCSKEIYATEWNATVEYMSPSGTESLNGSITVPTNLIVEWTGPNGYHGNGSTINNLGPGEYCYKVFDYHCDADLGGVSGEGCVTLVDCSTSELHPLTHLEIQTEPSCPCKSEGSITFADPNEYMENGWTFNLSFKPEQSTTPYDNKAHFDNLTSGPHTFIVLDPLGCTHEVIVEVPAKPFDDIQTLGCSQRRWCGGCYVQVSGNVVPEYRNPENCLEITWVCDLTGEVEGTGMADLGGGYIEWESCTQFQPCPDPIHGTIITEGDPAEWTRFVLQTGEDPTLASSYYCALYTGCQFEDPEGGEPIRIRDPYIPVKNLGGITTVTAGAPCEENSELCQHIVYCGGEGIGELCLECADSRLASPSSNSLNSFELFPNPFLDNLMLSCEMVNNNDRINFQLIDTKGNIRFQEYLNLERGDHEIELSISPNIESGLYYVKITDSYGTKIIKLVHTK